MKPWNRGRGLRERVLACFGTIDERRVDEGLADMVNERVADGKDEWIPVDQVRKDLGL